MAVVAAEASSDATTTREQEHDGSATVAGLVAASLDGPRDAAATATATAPGSTVVKRKRKPPLTPWKKPKDMPRRPLSAYNLFFKEQRESLMRKCLAAAAVERSTTTTTTSSSTTSSTATNAARSGKPRRSNKSVGIGFANLARTIAVHWNELNDETRAPYEAIAAREKNRYNAEMLVWRAKHQQQQHQQHLLQLQRVRRKDARSAISAVTENSLDSLVDNSNDLKATMGTESMASSMDVIDMDESVDEPVALAADTGARNRQRNTVHLEDHNAGAPASSHTAACTSNANSTGVSSTRHSVPSNPMGRDVLPRHQEQQLQGMMEESTQALHASFPPMDNLRTEVSQQQHSTTNNRRTVRDNSTSPTPLYATNDSPNASATTTTTSENPLATHESSSSAGLLEQHERDHFLRQELFLRQHQALLQQHQQQCHRQILRNNELIAQLQQQQKPELLGYGGGVSEYSHHGLATTMADMVNLFGSHHSFLMGQSMPLNYYQQQHQQQQQMSNVVRRETWSEKTTWNSATTSALTGMQLVNNESHCPSTSSASTLYGKRLPDSCLEPQDFRSTLSQWNTVPRATGTPGVSCGGSNNTDNDITKTFFPPDWFHLQDDDEEEDVRIPAARLPNTRKSSSASVTNTTTNLLMSRHGEIFGKLSTKPMGEPIHHTHEKVGVMKNKGSSIPTMPFKRVAKATSSAPTAVAISPPTLPPQSDSFLTSSLVEPSAFSTIKPEFDQDTMDFLERLRNGTTGGSTATNR